MRKLFIITLLLGIAQFLVAQTFRELPSLPIFSHINASDIAHGDVDGDGDEDLFIPGSQRVGQRFSLFKNDGKGGFTPSYLIEGNFSNGQASFVDLDGDSDLDLFYKGHSGGKDTLLFYLNNSKRRFSSLDAGNFPILQQGGYAFIDADGDKDQDLVICGFYDYIGEWRLPPVTLLYLNDGTGRFVSSNALPKDEGVGGTIKVKDLNGDGHDDVLIVGMGDNNTPKAVMYLGDGKGGFSKAANLPFVGGIWVDFDLGDVDGDGDEDIIITEQDRTHLIKLYLNDGSGTFVPSAQGHFPKLKFSSVRLFDVDGDNYPELLLRGKNNDNTNKTVLYENDGKGHFFKESSSKWLAFSSGAEAFLDVDGDADIDLIMSGEYSLGKNSIAPETSLFLNNGKGSFSPVKGLAFEGVGEGGHYVVGDIDGDQKEDIVGEGYNLINYRNQVKAFIQGNGGNYTEEWKSTATHFPALIALTDLDQDMNLDMMVSGRYNSTLSTTVWYKNDGNGVFQANEIGYLNQFIIGNMAFADFNGDGYPDMLALGDKDTNGFVKVLLNDKAGSFEEIENTGFVPVHYSNIAIADVDRDGDQDILICGAKDYWTPISKLYINDGFGRFTEETSNPFAGVKGGAIAFQDIDGDNAPDVILTGENEQGIPVVKLYLNVGKGHFMEVKNTPFEGVVGGRLGMGDLTGNGLPDILITGINTKALRSAKLYLNQGKAGFTEFLNAPFETIVGGDVKIFDYDGDKDMDILLSGYNKWDFMVTRVYINEGKGLGVHAVDPGQDFSFRVFPNPNEGKGMYLQLVNGNFGALRLTVKNVDGKVLMQHELRVDENGQNVFTPNLQLPAGIYVLELTDGQRTCARKVVVY